MKYGSRIPIKLDKNHLEVLDEWKDITNEFYIPKQKCVIIIKGKAFKESLTIEIKSHEMAYATDWKSVFARTIIECLVLHVKQTSLIHHL